MGRAWFGVEHWLKGLGWVGVDVDQHQPQPNQNLGWVEVGVDFLSTVSQSIFDGDSKSVVRFEIGHPEVPQTQPGSAV